MPKCQDCGFLYFHGGPREGYTEAVFEVRQSGSVSFHPNCLAHQFTLSKEAGERFATNKDGVSLTRNISGDYDDATLALFQRCSLEVITLDRDCPKFFPWKPGLGPVEHTYMSHEQEVRLEAERKQKEMQEWQAEQRKLDAERQAKQRREDLERQAAQRKEDQDRLERHRKIDSRQRYLLAIISVVTAVVSFFLGRFFEKRQDPPVVNVVVPGENGK